METFQDFIIAHPTEDDCYGCGQPHWGDWLVAIDFIEDLREQASEDELEISSLQDLIEFAAGYNNELAVKDCPVIWNAFTRWQRLQAKKRQLDISYGIQTAR
jgi:hypothetical protein